MSKCSALLLTQYTVCSADYHRKEQLALSDSVSIENLDVVFMDSSLSESVFDEVFYDGIHCRNALTITSFGKTKLSDSTKLYLCSCLEGSALACTRVTQRSEQLYFGSCLSDVDVWTEHRGFATHMWSVMPHHAQASGRDMRFLREKFLDHFYRRRTSQYTKEHRKFSNLWNLYSKIQVCMDALAAVADLLPLGTMSNGHFSPFVCCKSVAGSMTVSGCTFLPVAIDGELKVPIGPLLSRRFQSFTVEDPIVLEEQQP
ncbi:hypothetical protein T11_5963 [Trichinella zimbabwensis]|uniref:Uncharacterized protein n=1 Tax=Trichinella zimbabwensis TaxID=268475 RepID=A0A0V1H4E6_9BILA|nr:hypothetical protein T11_5963 [Trichinella zimbabwensis]